MIYVLYSRECKHVHAYQVRIDKRMTKLAKEQAYKITEVPLRTGKDIKYIIYDEITEIKDEDLKAFESIFKENTNE